MSARPLLMSYDEIPVFLFLVGRICIVSTGVKRASLG